MKPQHFADAQSALGFVRSQTAHVETEVYQTKYPAIRYRSLGVPVDTSASPTATDVIYQSMDYAGKAEWIGDRADDVPYVGTTMSEFSKPVYMSGLGYDYGFLEVQRAAMLGIPLSSYKAQAARDLAERQVDGIVFEGDAEKGLEGLFDYTGVPVTSLTVGDWANAAEDDILKDVNGLLAGINRRTAETAMADTLLLPLSRLEIIGSRRLGDTNQTVLQFLRENNIYTATTGQPLTIRGLRGLETSGAGGTPRIIALRMSPQVLKVHMPMPFQFRPVYMTPSGLEYKVPGIQRLGGLDIRLPNEVAYGDGS